MIGGLSVQMTNSFIRDFDRLSNDLRAAVIACIDDLKEEVVPPGRRLHVVSPKGKKPTIFTVDVRSNKSHKLSFQVENRVAILRRIATHKEIDRSP